MAEDRSVRKPYLGGYTILPSASPDLSGKTPWDFLSKVAAQNRRSWRSPAEYIMGITMMSVLCLPRTDSRQYAGRQRSNQYNLNP
ncbi:unnamed protein product [Pieris macdunnoughi]|uniref:Uncharacterized protein n=1 Tax=Pieris macdunnoughi TaxID=345717 RepID=A0A821VFP8_9NEOP|nr:unnamed protein product [Pieris macdunnoughi]